MYVAFIWPECDFQNGQWGAEPVDAFFVGLTPEEVRKFFPEIEFTEDQLSPTEVGREKTDRIGGKLYFLIGRDLSFADRFPWYYPISGQWNGGSPFVSFEREIQDLTELKDLK